LICFCDGPACKRILFAGKKHKIIEGMIKVDAMTRYPSHQAPIHRVSRFVRPSGGS
jgi:hypothetical protein